MEFNHKTVLLRECIEALNIKAEGIYVDGTLGGAGHSRGICEKLNEKGLLIGIDRDKDALKVAEERLKEYPCKKIFVQSNYSDIKNILQELEIAEIDGAILDLGVSSFQLDTPERGFSYMNEAPLDMRMNQDDEFTAYDVVNKFSEKDLADIISRYGEEKWASRIAKFIVRAREKEEIKDTLQLVEIIKAAIPARARRDGPHPAKRTFQAIRIEVNDELLQLEKAVSDFCDILAPQGRLAIISFHSLEDRIVKEIVLDKVDPCICPTEFPVCACGNLPQVKKITKKPIIPSDEEVSENPRSRSAKLRVVEKL